MELSWLGGGAAPRGEVELPATGIDERDGSGARPGSRESLEMASLDGWELLAGADANRLLDEGSIGRLALEERFIGWDPWVSRGAHVPVEP